jgi:hypothetical protein
MATITVKELEIVVPKLGQYIAKGVSDAHI